MGKVLNLIGKRYNRLVVISRAPNNKHGHTMWVARCTCGNVKTYSGSRIKGNHTKSCGCLSKELIINRSTKHGQASRVKKSRAYLAWKEMNRRVKRDPSYTKRNIKVCDEWVKDYQRFYTDMGDCPPNYELDRLDNSKGYEVSNCRWVSETAQSRNRSYTKLSIDKAREIRVDDRPYKQIAVTHNVSITTVERIKRGVVWKETE